MRPALLSLRDVAGRLTKSVKAVRALIHRGELEAVKIGRDWRVEPSAVEACLAALATVRRDGPTPTFPPRPVKARRGHPDGDPVRALRGANYFDLTRAEQRAREREWLDRR